MLSKAHFSNSCSQVCHGIVVLFKFSLVKLAFTIKGRARVQWDKALTMSRVAIPDDLSRGREMLYTAPTIQLGIIHSHRIYRFKATASRLLQTFKMR